MWLHLSLQSVRVFLNTVLVLWCWKECLNTSLMSWWNIMFVLVQFWSLTREQLSSILRSYVSIRQMKVIVINIKLAVIQEYNSGGSWSRFKDYDSGVHNNGMEGNFGSFAMHRATNKLMGRCSAEWWRNYSEWFCKRIFIQKNPILSIDFIV